MKQTDRPGDGRKGPGDRATQWDDANQNPTTPGGLLALFSRNIAQIVLSSPAMPPLHFYGFISTERVAANATRQGVRLRELGLRNRTTRPSARRAICSTGMSCCTLTDMSIAGSRSVGEAAGLVEPACQEHVVGLQAQARLRRSSTGRKAWPRSDNELPANGGAWGPA